MFDIHSTTQRFLAEQLALVLRVAKDLVEAHERQINKRARNADRARLLASSPGNPSWGKNAVAYYEEIKEV